MLTQIRSGLTPYLKDVALLLQVIYNLRKWSRRGSGLVVKTLASHKNHLFSIPGLGIARLWICVLLNVVTPWRSDGTLNRGLVCATYQTWTIKIPTVPRKIIYDCQLIQNCKQKKRTKNLVRLIKILMADESKPRKRRTSIRILQARNRTCGCWHGKPEAYH